MPLPRSRLQFKEELLVTADGLVQEDASTAAGSALGCARVVRAAQRIGVATSASHRFLRAQALLINVFHVTRRELAAPEQGRTGVSRRTG